jgi:uncharacterized membrane protein
MSTTRLEAFSDAVIAIIITIMVLEMKTPHEASLEALKPLIPVFLGYILSFIYLGIYWNNHHHMLHITEVVSGGLLWTNLHLLFWLSLVPFATGWMSETHFDKLPTALYGVVLLMAAFSWKLTQNSIIAQEGNQSRLARAVGRDGKGWISMVIYITGIGLSFLHTSAGLACYVAVALLWLVPDLRFERIGKQ